MATDDRQILVTGTAPAPATWLVPGNGQVTPRSIFAHFNGTGAGSAFYPAIKVISDAGQTVGIYPCEALVPAGGSADVSWFPGADLDEAQASGAPGVIVETFLVDSRVEAGATSSTVLLSGTDYVLTAQGTFSVWNTALGTGTPNANAMFPTSPPPARASTQVGLDPECAFAVQTGGGAVLGRGPWVVFNLGAGFVGLTPEDGPHTTPATNYIYTYRVTGQGSAVTVKVNDSAGQFADNYGYVQITVQSVSGQSSGGGGGGSLVPPGGSTQSVLRTVSGVPTWGAQPDIAETDLNLSDNTTANASTTKHGLLRKLDNTATHYLDGTGAWTTPSGSGTISLITSSGGSVALTNAAGPTTNVDVATSGVTGGTYGDSTHVAQVQVGADGRVTSASSVAISGSSGAGGLILLYDSTAGGSVTSFDTGANGVAAGHGHLVIYLILRSDGAVTIDTALLRFNGDSGNNYDYLWLRNAAGTLGSVSGFAQTAAAIGQSVGNSQTAGEVAPFKIDIPSYDQTTFRKAAIAHSGPTTDSLANSQSTHSTFSWRSTAAINQIAVFPQTGTHWLAGSRLTIYGAQ